jgi:general secretion pathway protein A
MYLKYYALREEPFNLTPDPRFMHLAQPYRVALDAVAQAILRRKGMIVVSGPVGVGKTTLLHTTMQMLNRINCNNASIAFAFVFNPVLSREEFLETLIAEFEVPCSSTTKPGRLSSLHKMFLEKQRTAGTSVLIVDEAHLLTVELLEEIRLLGNADTYREKLLQVILCGQPELLPLLQRPQLRALQQRITQYCSLRPLTEDETGSYVAERLQAAGLSGKSPFTSETIVAIHQHSHGVPRVINQICDGALVIGAEYDFRVVRPPVIEKVAAELRLNIEPESAIAPAVLDEAESNAARSLMDLLIGSMKQRRPSLGSDK